MLEGELRTEILQGIVDQVLIGSLNFREIQQLFLEYLDYEKELQITGALEEQLRRMIVSAFELHYEKQTSWGQQLTDTDKLENAFEALWAQGVVAATNFSCCQQHGIQDMKDWLEEDECQKMRGYLFFHNQDAVNLVRKDYLYLSFGSRIEEEKEHAAIAKESVALLNQHGIAAQWSGSVRTRIFIPKIEWRVRRVRSLDYAE